MQFRKGDIVFQYIEDRPHYGVVIKILDYLVYEDYKVIFHYVSEDNSIIAEVENVTENRLRR
jgi:SepF-like predicted cell division protein (DUF552 family)